MVSALIIGHLQRHAWDNCGKLTLDSIVKQAMELCLFSLSFPSGYLSRLVLAFCHFDIQAFLIFLFFTRTRLGTNEINITETDFECFLVRIQIFI